MITFGSPPDAGLTNVRPRAVRVRMGLGPGIAMLEKRDVGAEHAPGRAAAEPLTFSMIEPVEKGFMINGVVFMTVILAESQSAPLMLPY